MTKFYSSKKTIEIPFPNKVFESYLDKLSIKSEEELNNISIFQIIKKCYQDFKSGSLSLDNFSSIGGYLFNKLTNDAKDRSLGSVLLDIGELNFYIRDTNSKQNNSGIDNFLSSINRYFEQYN